MKITLKNRLAAIAAAFLLVFTSAVTLGSFRTDKAYALSRYYYVDGLVCYETYYFSDSDPAYKDYMPDDTFYDIHDGMSVAEFEFLVYGGYFMGFGYDYPRALVIIQLATIKPSEQTLNDLFDCLHYQNCYVMFLTPFYKGYGSLNCDVKIKCDWDDYDSFLRNSVHAMCDGVEVWNTPNPDTQQYAPESNNVARDALNWASVSGNGDSKPNPDLYPQYPEPEPEPERVRPDPNGYSVPDNTVLFLDGRYFGIPDNCEDLDIRQSYMYSRELRRLLGYMSMDYGYDIYDYNACEEGIYYDLWEAYTHLRVFDDYGITINRHNIDQTIEAWQRLYDEGASYLWNDFWYAYNLYFYDEMYEDVYGEFYNSYLSIIGEYYYEYVDYFTEKNMQIYAHANGDKYYSLLELDSDGINSDPFYCASYLFADYYDFLDRVDENNPDGVRIPIDYIYAIGTYYLKPDFYTFLIDFQRYIADPENSEELESYQIYSQGVTIFLWMKDSLIYDPNGLKIFTNYGLENRYGKGEGQDEDSFNYYIWLDIFLTEMSRLLGLLHSTPIWNTIS